MESPLWVTVLVGLGAGVLGSLLTTSLRIRHEREADLRKRMLECADDFCAVAGDAIDAVRELRSERAMAAITRSNIVRAPQTAPLPSTPIDTDRANKLISDLVEREPRIRLLFGPTSATSDAAKQVRIQLFDDVAAEENAIERDADEEVTEVTIYDAIELSASLDAFCVSARRDLRRGSILRAK